MRHIIIVVSLLIILIAIGSCKSHDQARTGMNNTIARKKVTQSAHDSYQSLADQAYINQVKAKAEQMKRDSLSDYNYREVVKNRQTLNENQHPEVPASSVSKSEMRTNQQISTSISAISSSSTRQASQAAGEVSNANNSSESYDGPFANLVDDVLQSSRAPKSSSVNSSSPTYTYDDILDNNPVRNENIIYLNEYDRISLKKYNIVIASLSRYDGARRLQKKLIDEGEQVTIIKGNNNMYRVIIGSFDTEEESVSKIKSIGLYYRGQYTSSQLQSKYGIPFSGLWILVN